MLMTLFYRVPLLEVFRRWWINVLRFRVLSLKFNVCKSHCMIIGKIYKTKISPMLMGNQLVEWCDCIKYLGVYLVSSSDIKFDINPVKRCFYAACNSIFSHSSGLDEIALLTLQESIPII